MNTNKLIKSYCQNPEVANDLIFYYVFILDEHSLKAQQKKRISDIQSKQITQIKPLGFSLKDYQQIQRIILTKSSSKRIKNNIILVTDMKNCEQILQLKMKGDSMRGVHEVYLCYEQQQKREAEQLIDYFGIINKQTHNLEDIIGRAEENFRNLRQNRKILANFKLLEGKNFKKQSYLLKVRAKGCIGLQQRQYQKYKDNFLRYLERYLSIRDQSANSSFANIKNRLETVLQILKRKSQEQFVREMLKLYQTPQTIFYEVINNGMMNFAKQSFVEWKDLALPFSLLYNAIKKRYKYIQKQIEKLFGNKDFIQVWRGGKITRQELQQLEKSLKEGRSPFFELSSFTSTSLDQKIAEGFLDQRNPQSNCLMKIKLMKPTNKQEIQNFSFIYLSFAIMPSDEIDQKQILLNALTMARLTNISYQNRNQVVNLKNLSPQSKKQHVNNGGLRQRGLPILELEVGRFEDVLQRYSKKGELNDYQKEVVEHYLITVDFIKNYEFFDIGDSLRLTGELKAAYEYDKQKIKQLEAKPDEQLTKKQLLRHHKRYEEVCERHADTCFDLGYEKEAIDFAELSIQACKQNQKLAKDLTIKQREELINQRLAKKSFMLQFFGRVGQACQQIKDRIEVYKKQITSKKDTQLACQFFIAKLLINLGLIWLMQGKHKKAKKYFDQSQQRVKKILKQIDYEGLKTETFYFQLIKSFIIHYIFCGTNPILDKEEFFRIQRSYKMVQATYIFGGVQQFETVVQNSKRLKEYVQKFIQNDRKIERPVEEGAIRQSQLTRVERQFTDHQLTKQLQPQVQDYFIQFKKSIRQGQESTLQKKSKELYSQIFAAVERNLQQIHKFDLRLDTTKGQLIASKLSEWKKIDYSQRNSALSIKLNSQRHILKLKEMQNQHLIQSLHINGSQYRQFLKEQVNLITKHLNQREDFDYHQPTLETIKYKLKREEIMQKEGNEKHAKLEIENIIKDTKTNKNFIQRQIEAYLISVRIHHSIADFDFLQCLQLNPYDKRIQIKQIQKRMIKTCEEQLQSAANSIKQFRKLMRKQNRQKYHDNPSNKFGRIRISIEQKSNCFGQERDKKLNKKLSKQNVQILIWKAKCKILIFRHVKQTEKNEKKAQIRLHLNAIQSQLNRLSDSQKTQLSPFYNEVRGYYDLYADDKARNGISYLERSLSQALCFAQTQRTMILKTKLSFMHYVHDVPLSNLLKNLSKDEQFYMNYPFYWRLCLANHYNNKKKDKRNDFYIKHCLRFIQQMGSKDDYWQLRYALIRDYQYKCYLEYSRRSSSQNSFRGGFIQLNRRSVMPRSNSINLKAESTIKGKKQKQLNLSIQIPQVKEFAQKFEHQKFDVQLQQKSREDQEVKNKNDQVLREKSIQKGLQFSRSTHKKSPRFKRNSLQQVISNISPQGNISPYNNLNGDLQLISQENSAELVPRSESKLEQSSKLSRRYILSRKSKSRAEYYSESLGQIQFESEQLKKPHTNNESKRQNKSSSNIQFKEIKPVSKESHDSVEKMMPKRQRGIDVISKGSSRRLLKKDSLVSVELIKRVISNFSQPKEEVLDIRKQIKQTSTQQPQSKPYSSTNNSILIDNFMKKNDQSISSPRIRPTRLLQANSNETKDVNHYYSIMKRRRSNMSFNAVNKSLNPLSFQEI